MAQSTQRTHLDETQPGGNQSGDDRTRCGTILVVDDDPHIREGLSDILDHAGHDIIEASDGKTALHLIKERDINLMLLDLQLPRVGGMSVLKQVANTHPGLPVVIVSGKGTIQTAVEATKLGAYDFLEKPVDAQRTLITVRNALEKSQLEHDRNRLLREVRARYQMVGSSEPMQRVYDLIDKAAATSSKVLITGENGTGKELVARAIHHNSARASEPFVTVNCAAIPESLIESELFGHEKGAFTGAKKRRKGKFEQADGGTLFLDEVGDMGTMTQAKALRALQEGTIQRVGGEKPISVDARVIAATNKNLKEEIDDGTFREDLYYRLNIIAIEVPPLRARREDIPKLIDHFLEQFSEANSVAPRTIDSGALAKLMGREWPGNVRQLRNVVERLVALSDSATIQVADVGRALQETPSTAESTAENNDLRSAREEFERSFIHRTLMAHDGGIQDTADALGISRSHLWKKMKRYEIEAPGE